MSKVLIVPIVLSVAFADLSWGTRCEYRGVGCTRGVSSCATFRLVNGCANDQTAFQISSGALTVEEKACTTDNVMNLSAGAFQNAFDECQMITSGTTTRYVKFFATDDEDASLRSYTLEDLDNCSELPADKTDLFFDTYTMHSDAFMCSAENTLNLYSYVSKNNKCDENGVKPIYTGTTLTINTYNDVITCETAAETGVEPVQSFYRTDGSCLIGKFQSVEVGLFHAHLGLCGEPKPRAQVTIDTNGCKGTIGNQASSTVGSVCLVAAAAMAVSASRM
eukprot:GDKJ01015659.1.p1 GENE.GDKJ01015659.1~~GDKJ01015659.1.p1  ORF type:complete len:294 (-),score=38.72 GDKJ01015659.1:660-1493(-)